MESDVIEEIQIIKIMEHGLTERSRYHTKNIDGLIREFQKIKTIKEIHLRAMAKEIRIIRQNEKEDLPRILEEDMILIVNPDVKEQCYSITHQIYQKLMKQVLEEQRNYMETLIEVSGSKMERKQEKFQYQKAIKKKMQTCTKVFKDCRMEGYDFREIDLSGALFINCRLKNANFSHVNMEQTIFVNCDLSGAIFYKAYTNAMSIITGNNEDLEAYYKRYEKEKSLF